MDEQKTSMWLRIGEIIAGIIVLALGGYALAYPGATAATLIAFLAVGLLVIAGIEFVRVSQRAFQDGNDLRTQSVTYHIFVSASSARRAVVLGRIDPRLAGSFDVDLREVSGRRARHSGGC